MVRWDIESTKAERPFKGKDHDRVFTDDERHIYAVFDGAGNALASSIALGRLRQIVELDRSFNVVTALESIHNDIYRQLGGNLLTTGSLIHLEVKNEGLQYNFASAGDSPIYRYGHQDGKLLRDTYDESIRHPSYIEAHNFLGSSRHKLQQFGRFILTESTGFVIASDGITDEYYQGHVTDGAIGSALAAAETPQQAANDILGQAAEFDDASLIVIRASV